MSPRAVVVAIAVIAAGCGSKKKSEPATVEADAGPSLAPAPARDWWKASPPCPDGTELVGEEKSSLRCEAGGAPNGPSATWQSDTLELGTYRDGKKNGQWEWYRGDQKIRAGGYADDKPHGTFTEWAANSQKLGSWEMNQGNGTMVAWWFNGKLREKVGYRDGLPDGPQQSWHSDGSKASEGQWEKNRQVGEWVEYLPGGQVWKKYSFDDGGLLHGVATEWHINGSKEAEGSYSHGKKDGTWTYLDHSGKLLTREEWHAGERIQVFNGEAGEERASPAPAPGAASATPDKCGGYAVIDALPERAGCKRDDDCAFTSHRPGNCNPPLCSGHYQAGATKWVAAVDALHDQVCGAKKYDQCVRVRCVHKKPTGVECKQGKCELRF